MGKRRVSYIMIWIFSTQVLVEVAKILEDCKIIDWYLFSPLVSY